MTKNSARKKTIRARQAATGEAYTAAARALDATGQNAMAAPHGQAVDAVAALTRACEHFATHVRLLADQLAAAELSPDDVERAGHAVHQVAAAAGLAAAVTTGLRRHTGPQACPHYNVLTDAEWAPLGDGPGAVGRQPAYECWLQPGHPGPHAAHVQEPAETYRGVWLRWDGATRELVDLAYCPARLHGEQPGGTDDECCDLYAEHAGAHAVGFWASTEELEQRSTNRQ